MHPSKNEFSRLIEVKKIHDTPKTYNFVATEEEAKNLALRFGFDSLSDIEINASITKKGSRIFIEGIVTAKIQQNQSSALNLINEELKVLIFTDHTAKDFDADRLEENIEDKWDCDLIEEENIDIGEIIAQYISLSVFQSSIGGDNSGQAYELF